MYYIAGIKIDDQGIYLVVLNLGHIQSSLWEAREPEP